MQTAATTDSPPNNKSTPTIGPDYDLRPSQDWDISDRELN